MSKKYQNYRWDDEEPDYWELPATSIEEDWMQESSTDSPGTEPEESIRSSKSYSLHDFFGNEEDDDDIAAESPRAFPSLPSDNELWDIFATETNVTEAEDDDDALLSFLQSNTPRSLKDFFNEDDDMSTESSPYIEEDTLATLAEQVVVDTTSLPSSMEKGTEDKGAEETDSKDPVPTKLTVPAKKDNSKRLTLQEMQSAIVAKVPVITHNGGLYYYNGRTYTAIGNSYDLLTLIRSKVSPTAFSSASTKPFFDLLIYLKADECLVPVNYETRLRRSKYLTVMRNGVLDVRTLDLLPYTSHYLTFHEFDAKYTDKKPKVFLRFLEQSSGGDPEIVQRVVEVMGYLFSGLNMKYFFVAGTAPNSGKSTLGLLLQSLIGEEQVSSISTHQLDARFALGGTRNKILNLAMDVSKGHLSSVTVSILKSVTGGDPINIEEKYQQPERIISGLRFLFGTNYKITVPQADDEDAFWDRMVILPFLVSVPPERVDYTLLDKMLDEKDRIISYCLRAMSEVLQNNGRFSPCRVADEMKADWRNTTVDTRSFEIYWDKVVEVTGNPNDSVFAMDLYDGYCQYCKGNSLEPIPYNGMKNWIIANVPMTECAPKRIHRTNANPRAGFVGIRFINNERSMNII